MALTFLNVVGHFGYFSHAGKMFLKSCVANGIPHSPDVNTSKGTRGVTKVRFCFDPLESGKLIFPALAK